MSFARAGERMAAIWSNGVTPEEVYVGPPKGGLKAVTTFGASFRGRLQPTEHVNWKADDGQVIEGILTYPINYQRGTRYPLVVEIHGGPSWQWEDRAMLTWHDWAQWLASRGYAVLMPNPRGAQAMETSSNNSCRTMSAVASRGIWWPGPGNVERGVADPDRLGIAG